MKFESKHIIPIVISVISLFLLCQFRSLPVSQFWKGYRVLYVYTEELTEPDILAILEKNGCSSVISYGRQRLPIVSSLSPVQVQDENSYIYRRSAFFTDRAQKAQVFYIPENQSSQLDRSIRELAAFKSTNAGTDGKSSFPWIAPVICLLFFVLLVFFSNERILFTAGTAFFVILAFSRPLYTVSAASSFYLFAFFIFHRIWGRKDFLKIAMNSPVILLFSIFPVLGLLLSSPLHSLFYIIAAAGAVSLVYLYSLFEQEREARYPFKPLLIRSARMIPLFGRLGIRLLGALLVSLCILSFCFKLSGNVSSIASSATMPSLPAPVSRGDSEIVQLSDFISWSWNSVTFPYRKIGDFEWKEPSEGEVVSITDYREENGRILAANNPAFVYNSEFRESIYKAVEKLEYPALEKMMLRQGKNARFGYARNASSSSSERFGLILLLIFIAVPAAFGIHYIMGRKRYGLSI